MSFEFSIAKLESFRARWVELVRSDSPFAIIVMAHLKTQDTRLDEDRRYNAKLDLVRMIRKKGFSLDTFRNIFGVIDWMMQLSDEKEMRFNAEMRKIEEEIQMTFMSHFETLTMEKGIEKGIEKGKELGKEMGSILTLRESILDLLRAKHEKIPAAITRRVKAISDAKQLRAVWKRVLCAETMAEVKAALDL